MTDQRAPVEREAIRRAIRNFVASQDDSDADISPLQYILNRDYLLSDAILSALPAREFHERVEALAEALVKGTRLDISYDEAREAATMALSSPTPAPDVSEERAKLALAAAKVVTATAKDGAKGLGRIMRLAIDAGITQPYSELLKDPRIALLVSDAPLGERRTAFAAQPATVGESFPMPITVGGRQYQVDSLSELLRLINGGARIESVGTRAIAPEWDEPATQPAPMGVGEERAREVLAEVDQGLHGHWEGNEARTIRAMLAFAARPATDEPTSPELVEIIRQWLMSTDHEVSDWERQFAAAIESTMRAAGWTKPAAQPATLGEGEGVPRGDWYGYDRYVEGKFEAGYLLDREQEPELREVAKFNCRGLAETIGKLIAASQSAPSTQPAPIAASAGVERTGKYGCLREMLDREIERRGSFESFMIRAGLLSDILDDLDAALSPPPVAERRRGHEIVAEHNKAIDDGTLAIDPRHDSNHPLHDIVCGWCGKIHPDSPPSSPVDDEDLKLRKAVNTILGELLAPLMPDLIERIKVGNHTCSLILAALASPVDGEEGK